jgi:threonine-phosphate decarboxylase
MEGEKKMENFRDAGGHGGDLLAAASEFGIRSEEFCDFSSNVNPLGPPPGLEEELKANLHEICRYPTPQARDFRAGLAACLDFPEERILIGNGANELIHLLFLWIKPQKVLIPYPAFSEYARAARLAGAAVEGFPLPLDATLDTRSLIKSLAGVDLCIFCSPNNPTGFFYHEDLLEEVVCEAGKKGVLFFLDESFLAFTGKPAAESFSRSGYSNLWVVTSLTKLWALPGLRLGFLTGPRDGIKSLTQNGDPWRVNALAQRAGLYCLSCTNYLQQSVDLVRKEREFLLWHLQDIKELRVFPGEANFLLLRGEKAGFSSADIYRYLASRGILIRNAENYPGLDQRYFRIAVRRREDNVRLLQELQNYFSNYES